MADSISTNFLEAPILKTLATCSILSIMFSVMGCRQQVEKTVVKSDSNQGSGNVSGTSNELDGTWKQACRADLDSKGVVKNFNTTEVTHSGTKVSGITTVYLDSECKNKALSVAITGVMDSGKVLTQPQGAKNYDLTASEMQLTIFSPEYLDGYNGKNGGSAVCGGGWSIGQKRIILKDTCGESDETFKDSFAKNYGIYSNSRPKLVLPFDKGFRTF